MSSTDNPTDVPVTAPADSPAADPPEPFLYYCGIDFGCYASVVCSSFHETPTAIDLCTNDLSGRSTPSYVSFTDSQRLVGDAARDRQPSRPTVTLSVLPLLLPVNSKDDIKRLKERFGPVVSAIDAVQPDGTLALEFGSPGELSGCFPVQQLIAPFLRRLASFGVDCQTQKQGGDMTLAAGKFCVALPDSLLCQSEELRDTTLRCMSRACRTGALNAERTRILSQSTAIVEAWSVKNLKAVWDSAFPEEVAGPRELMVCFYSVGLSETSLIALRVTDAAASGTETPSTNPGGVVYDGRRIEVVAQAVMPDFGTAEIVKELSLLIASRMGEETAMKTAYDPEQSLDVKGNKVALRIVKAAEDAMKSLSAVKDSRVVVAGAEEDFQFDVTRDQLEECTKGHRARLAAFVQRWFEDLAVAQSSDSRCFVGVELAGEGTRIPFVRDVVEEALTSVIERLGKPLAPELVIRRTVDSVGVVATGATLAASEMGAKVLTQYPISSSVSIWKSLTERDSAMATERKFREIERIETARLGARNALESKLMEVEKIMNDCPTDTEGLAKYHTSVTDWFLDNESASAESFQSRTADLDKRCRETCSGYFEALAKQRAEQERKMAEAAEKAKAEADGAEKEDHDTRKLPNSQRITMAKKNKEEANENLKGNLLAPAVRHYLKALQHLSKMFDESPTELEEKTALQISCNLNLALVYLRERSDVTVKRAIDCCNAVLVLDPMNQKALYRRSIGYEYQKNWTDALKDINRALELTDTPDPAVLKAKDRINKYIAHEKAKERKMYSRMF